MAALDAEVDYSKFDNDGDGKTEAISLLYAGDEGTFGKGLWPHASGSSEQHDGVRLNRYMMTAMNNKPTNYVFSHESGHMLFGWPDLYGVGDYCIMANRGSDTNPVGINDMFRADQGWVDIVDVDSKTNARLSTTPDGVVYRFLNPARPNEYFLWSNLENKDEWVSIAGSGLLVWHFDKSIQGNDPPKPLQLAVVQAGGQRQLSATTWPEPGSAAADLYAKAGKAEVGPQTQPSTKWNDGSASGLRIYDISAPAATMEFSVGTGPLPSGGTGSVGGTSAGGAATGGNASSAGNTSSAGNNSGSAGTPSAQGGADAGPTSTAGNTSTGGAGQVSTGGAPSASAGTAGSGDGVIGAAPSDTSGCSCRLAPSVGRSNRSALAGLFALGWLFAYRRRRASSPRRVMKRASAS